MADRFKGLVDQWGRPIEKAALTAEIAAPSLSGTRTPLTAYPGDGLDPQRLAQILRAADTGDPVSYLELAEQIEERDPHYAGVLSTRKRSVSQLEVTVEAASDDPIHKEQAERVEEWLTRDELADETFDMLDAVGKGYSFTEIIWDSSAGQWEPKRLEWRDPRWFEFERHDLSTPLMIDDGGQRLPLPGFKFIYTRIRSKSGLPVRSGLARVAFWAYLFKKFTERDWAIFTQNFGQPVRIGKYGSTATDEDRRILLRAVANIASDCAAIMPDSMSLEFVEASNLGTGHTNYKERADWYDRQVSKLVLGQTATTDAIAGGHAVGKEHRQVQEDIERADAKALSAVINRDLIAPWMALDYGPDAGAPRVRIGRADETDVKLAVDAVAKLIPLGLKAGKRQMANLIGIGEPAEDDELLTSAATPVVQPEPGADKRQGADRGQPGGPPMPPAPKDDEGDPDDEDETALAAQPDEPPHAIDRIAADALSLPEAGSLIAQVEALAKAASSLEELAAMLEAARLDSEGVTAALARAMLLAELTGRDEMRK